MTYNIYVNGKYETNFRFIIDVLSYVNEMNLKICDEVEDYEQHSINIYC